MGLRFCGCGCIKLIRIKLEQMQREYLSNIDNALLRLDSARNRMIVTGLMTFASPLESARLQSVLEQKLLIYPRFRQRIAHPYTSFGRAYWEVDPFFNMDHHISVIHTPLPEDPVLIQSLVSRLLGLGMDPARPLWQAFLVEKYGEGSVLILRFHHTIADGMSLVKVLLSITDDQPEPGSTSTSVSSTATAFTADGNHHYWRSGPLQIFSKAATAGWQMLTEKDGFVNAAQLGASALTAFRHLVMSAADTDNIFRGDTGIDKRAAWTPSISLEKVKNVGAVYGCLVNDVLLSAAAGALRKYIDLHSGELDDLILHGFIPIDLRRESRRAKTRFISNGSFNGNFGNKFGFGILALPVGQADPVLRLRSVHDAMDEVKDSGDALVSYLILNVFGAVPGEIEDLASYFWITKGSTIITNVAGPDHQLYLGGVPVETMMGWVPQHGDIGLGISIFSYNGNVRIGIATDESLVPDPEKIVDYFMEEFELLYGASLAPDSKAS
jgi:diacylglycerol O-acyltransferase